MSTSYIIGPYSFQLCKIILTSAIAIVNVITILTYLHLVSEQM